MVVIADDRGVEISEAIDLGGAQKHEVQFSALGQIKGFMQTKIGHRIAIEPGIKRRRVYSVKLRVHPFGSGYIGHIGGMGFAGHTHGQNRQR